MRPPVEVEGARVFLRDCRDVLKTLPDNSVDSVVTDPPYELGFMGKSWDNSGIAYDVTVWEECLRVLKPGGHILAFGGTRTWHRLAVAIEDAGFEIRDNICWLYGSGFPKSLDVSKAIDKSLGAERAKIQTRMTPKSTAGKGATNNDLDARPWLTKAREQGFHEHAGNEPATAEAEQWQGWGTALKPAFEPVVVGRKPIEGTVASNVLEWGVGGLNIDGSRIGSDSTVRNSSAGTNGEGWGMGKSESVNGSTQGRWPANVVLDEFTAGLLDEQSGVSKSPAPYTQQSQSVGIYGAEKQHDRPSTHHGDAGGASRFFYQAKASKRDRNEGLGDLNNQKLDSASYGINSAQSQTARGRNPEKQHYFAQNFHPTVKPTQLMRYLIKLVTPEGGTVLDPFTGSGSTGKAALLDGYRFIGAELTEEYLPIIEGRLRWAVENRDEETLF